MRIVANKKVTKWERERGTVYSKDWERRDLFNAIGQKLYEMNPLFFESKIEEDIEYRAEVFVLSRDTYSTIMSQLQGALSQGEFERIRNIFMNQI
jgi:hypothetical protein